MNYSRDYYFVYAKGELYALYTQLNRAIQAADNSVGIVLNDRQQYVWERGNTAATAKTKPAASATPATAFIMPAAAPMDTAGKTAPAKKTAAPPTNILVPAPDTPAAPARPVAANIPNAPVPRDIAGTAAPA